MARPEDQTMNRGRVLLVASSLVFLVALSVPLFFEIYRTMAFNTHPRDDYGPYLQAIVGQGGEIPGAPMIYRLFSVVAAVPFYFLLPVYSFSKLPPLDPAYLRATEALAAVSWLSILATAGVIYLICRRKLGASERSSLIVALLSVFCSGYIGQVGVDPICVLMISLLIYFIDRPVPFAALMLLSIGLNEKVAILFTVLLLSRLVFGRDRSTLPQLAVSVVAATAYFAIRLLVDAPGYENQLTPSSYLPALISMVPVVFSLKGFVTDLLPTLLVAAIAVLDVWTIRRLGIDTPVFRWPDVAVLVAMFVIGMGIDMQYTVGRIVMFTYPLYLPVLALQIDDWFPDREPSAATV